MLNETAPGRALSFELGRAFGPEEAARIHELIEHAAPGTAIDIDFRHVRDCHDVALAALARDIVRGRARVALHGTSQHQQRLLRYLGVCAAAARR